MADTTWRSCAIPAVMLVAAPPAVAQDVYPIKPVRFLVGFAPGGGQDIVARIFAKRLGEAWKQSVIVENRPGANGIIAAEIAAKAAPDGYTLFLGTIGDSTNVSMYRKLPYDIVKDFAPVALLSSVPYMVSVHPALPVKSVRELIAYAKARPGQLTHGSSGAGGGIHLSTELFKSMSGLDIVHVPYKGTGPALVDLISGQIQLYFATMLSAIPHSKSGRIRSLAVTGENRSPIMPEVPTVAESGLPGYEAGSWSGLLVPASTPKALVAKLNGDVVTILKAPEVIEFLSSQGAEPGGGTPQDYGRFMKAEIAKWAVVVKAIGARAD